MNGYYQVKLTAYTSNGQGLYDEITVLVTGQAKIGNYSISFLDMTLPVAGLPVEIYRTYDSRQRTQLGDFGYGWTMSVGGPSISITNDLCAGWTQLSRTILGIVPQYFWMEEGPHEVYVDWGNGNSETFAMKLNPEQNNAYRMEMGISAYFKSVDGSSTLEILDPHEDLMYSSDGVLYSLEGVMDKFQPKNFLLTRYDGLKFYLNVDRGLYKFVDEYGRVYEITDNKISCSDGEVISFVKDAEGRITSISDGLGNEVTYTYDVSGNLIKVNDTAGYDTKFAYDNNHYLTEIYSHDGTRVAKNEYDDDGRLVATIDPDGRRIEYTHDLDQRMEVIKDKLGYNTIYYYDENGNVTSITDARNNTTVYTYDGNNNKSSETRPDGTTITYTYDKDNHLLTETDPYGNAQERVYNSESQLVSLSYYGTPEYEYQYNSDRLISQVTDSLGNTQHYQYSDKGELLSVTDNLGVILNISYDQDGNIASTTDALGTVTNYNYDAEGRLTSKSVTAQGTTYSVSYTYNAANQVVSAIHPDGLTESFDYDLYGNLISKTDYNGATYAYDFDIYGNLIKISYPDGTEERFTYDAEGRNLTATDRMGRTARFTYDAVGNCTCKEYANGAKDQYEYDCCNRVISSTNTYGGKTTYGYDALGRNTTVTDPDGNVTTYTYTEKGYIKSVTDARGNTKTFGYDNMGNQTSVTYPNGGTFTSTFDERGRMTSESDAYSNATTYSYDALDRLVGVTDAEGNTWKYTYDAFGNVETITDCNGGVTTYTYDLNGQVVSEQNAAGYTSTTSYDQFRRIETKTDFDGKETVYTYDSLNRVASTTTEGEVTEYKYDAYGNLKSVTDSTGTISYTYNIDGYLSSVTNADGEVITYTYNLAGDIESISIDGQSVIYAYDLLGRLVSVTDAEGETRYSYDEVGNRATIEYPNGIVVSYEYSNMDVLTKQTATDSVGNVLLSYEYTIGLNGERLSCTELNRRIDYGYDKAERLISETVTVGSNTSVTTYAYDKNSNRISMDKDGVVTTYEYNELNQLTRAGDILYTWDAAGNLVSKNTDTGMLVASYKYDSQNRMISATVNDLQGTVTETYTYDYSGTRTSKTSNGVTTKYTTDMSSGYSQVIKAETGVSSTYYTRGFELISQRNGNDATYYLFDGGMSVRALTDESGSITDEFVFDAYGNGLERTGTTNNSYGFQGEENDATGLYYLRARYMDPSTGTFTSMDTYQGNTSDPMSLHRYRFTRCNPIKYCDPSGHADFTLESQMGAIAIMGILLCAFAINYSYFLRTHRHALEISGSITVRWGILQGLARLAEGVLADTVVSVIEDTSAFISKALAKFLIAAEVARQLAIHYEVYTLYYNLPNEEGIIDKNDVRYVGRTKDYWKYRRAYHALTKPDLATSDPMIYYVPTYQLSRALEQTLMLFYHTHVSDGHGGYNKIWGVSDKNHKYDELFEYFDNAFEQELLMMSEPPI